MVRESFRIALQIVFCFFPLLQPFSIFNVNYTKYFPAANESGYNI